LCEHARVDDPQKSWKSVKGPPFSVRSAISRVATPSPTLRTAESPNRIEFCAPSSHPKSLIDAFTHGTSTGMSSWRHSLR
jgi:hypothetical protein